MRVTLFQLKFYFSQFSLIEWPKVPRIAQKGTDLTVFQQPKKDREQFRKALVDVIWYVVVNNYC